MLGGISLQRAAGYGIGRSGLHSGACWMGWRSTANGKRQAITRGGDREAVSVPAVN